MEGSKNMWRTVKDLTGNCKQTPPRTISFDGELITSIKKICNLANEHYISKISKIRSNFSTNLSVTPIRILEKKLPRCRVDVNIYLHLFQLKFYIIIYPPLFTLKRLS